jgi:uncharacterized surface protein with fasciclin (FAS1) repeats
MSYYTYEHITLNRYLFLTIAVDMATIAEIAIQSGNFTTLVKALEAAGLVDPLKNEGPFTVFAPDDNAFKKLPQGTVESLLKDTQKLKDVLLYHVVQGKVTSTQAMQMTSGGKIVELKTLQGQTVKVSQRGFFGKSLYVNNAKVTKADIEASNGIIHVIDSVILPK